MKIKFSELPKKYPDKCYEAFQDSDGYWIYLHGYSDHECHTIKGDTPEDAIKQLLAAEICHCDDCLKNHWSKNELPKAKH